MERLPLIILDCNVILQNEKVLVMVSVVPIIIKKKVCIHMILIWVYGMIII